MKNLKLNEMASENLSKVEMNQVRGGNTVCSCGCQGSSSVDSNAVANYNGGKTATAPAKQYVVQDDNFKNGYIQIPA